MRVEATLSMGAFAKGIVDSGQDVWHIWTKAVRVLETIEADKRNVEFLACSAIQRFEDRHHKERSVEPGGFERQRTDERTILLPNQTCAIFCPAGGRSRDGFERLRRSDRGDIGEHRSPQLIQRLDLAQQTARSQPLVCYGNGPGTGVKVTQAPG